MLTNLCLRRLMPRISPSMIGKYNAIYRGKSSSAAGVKDSVGAIDADTARTNEPIQYFGSDAAEWRAKDSRSGGAEDVLWYQPYVVSGSLVIFLIYFCMLREENDIDRKLEGSLFDHVQGLEEMQLAVSYKYNKENGLSTKDIEERLTQLGIDVKQLDLKSIN